MAFAFWSKSRLKDEKIKYRSHLKSRKLIYEGPTEVINYLNTYLISHRQSVISLHVHLGLQLFEYV